MLASVYRDNETAQAKNRERIKILEAKASTSAAKYSKELSIKLNEPIRKCYQNEKKCDRNRA